MGILNRILDLKQQPIRIAVISSYIPRKCGIATYTKDLTKAVNDLNPQELASIMAMGDGERYDYPPEVAFQLERDDLNGYRSAAEYLNSSDADIVCLQHEYGLFGGDAGEYIFVMLSRVRQPIVTTLHTILADPTDEQRDVLFRLGKLSAAVVAMIPDAKERLERDYGIPGDKVVVIHHGVADRPKSTQEHKERLGWKGRQVLLMTGLLNPDKGAEYVVRALPEIRKRFPEVLFCIVGQTHPGVLKSSGEAYRESLQALAKELGVEENMVMVNKYVSLDTLLEYYDGCDIYLTPHLNPQQITSGTLAYALGMGKACISTPYFYAKEMLDSGAGILVPFKDADSIAAAVVKILSDLGARQDIEKESYRLGRSMSWPRVAERYLILFRILQEGHDNGLVS